MYSVFCNLLCQKQRRFVMHIGSAILVYQELFMFTAFSIVKTTMAAKERAAIPFLLDHCFRKN